MIKDEENYRKMLDHIDSIGKKGQRDLKLRVSIKVGLTLVTLGALLLVDIAKSLNRIEKSLPKPGKNHES